MEITLEKIWQKLDSIDEKINDLAEYVADVNLETRTEVVNMREEVQFIKHNTLLVRQFQALVRTELEKLDETIEASLIQEDR